jgi:hypothetical protein
MPSMQERRFALREGLHNQPRWWVARAAWGIAWWGLPFFLLWSVAGTLLRGGQFNLVELAFDAAMSALFGALFGLIACAAWSRRSRSPYL